MIFNGHLRRLFLIQCRNEWVSEGSLGSITSKLVQFLSHDSHTLHLVRHFKLLVQSANESMSAETRSRLRLSKLASRLLSSLFQLVSATSLDLSVSSNHCSGWPMQLLWTQWSGCCVSCWFEQSRTHLHIPICVDHCVVRESPSRGWKSCQSIAFRDLSINSCIHCLL